MKKSILHSFRPLYLFMISLSLLVSLISCSKPIDEEAMAAYLSARSDYEAGNLNRSGEVFADLYSRHPDFYQSGFMHGKTLFFEGDLGGAEKVFKHLIHQHPQFYDAHFWLARTIAQEGRLDEATGAFEELLSYSSQNEDILYELALIAIEKEDLPDALANLQRAKLYSEESSRIFIQLGRLYHQYGVPANALNELKTAQVLLPDDHGLQRGIRVLIERIEEGEKE